MEPSNRITIALNDTQEQTRTYFFLLQGFDNANSSALTATASSMAHTWEMSQADIERRKSSVVVELNDAHGNVRRVSVGELNEADKALAAEFGYKPVFKREFGYFAAFSFAVSISGTFATIATTFSYPLYAGGSASAVWCWFISGLGCMCIAVSSPQLWDTSKLVAEPHHSVLFRSLCPHIRQVVDCTTRCHVSLLQIGFHRLAGRSVG